MAKEVQSLVGTCESILLKPDDSHNLQTLLPTFLEEYPVGTITKVLEDVCSGPGNQQEASTIIRGIKHLTETTTNTAALKEMLTPAQHALAAGSPQLRALGCDILSAWLKKQEPSADITQQVALLIHMLEHFNLHKMVQDGETEVAAAAASALQCLADPADRLHQWLHPKSPSALLAAALNHQDATVRSRALSLTVNLAASSPDAAQMVLSSGALDPFLRELANGSDLLARLAALEQLLELSETATVPPELRARILPSVVKLLDASQDPALLQAAIPAAARLLRDGSAPSQTSEILGKLSSLVLDEEVPPGMEACILDACHTLAHTPSTREAVAVSPLLPHAAERALGRGAPNSVCIPAMHTIAAVGGAEHQVWERGTVAAAQLSAPGEEALKQAVYDKALASQSIELGPAQRVLELLQAPFSDRKVPAYRMCAVLSARTWFALEVCQHTALLAHITDAHSESGEELCMWRFSMLRVLCATAVAAGAESALGHYAAQLQEAVAKGPYGASAQMAGGIPDVEPQVAVASRPG